LRSAPGAARCTPQEQITSENFVGGSSAESPQWRAADVAATWYGRSGNASLAGQLQAMRVEDRYFYLDLFAALSAPSAAGDLSGGLAYWWERLPPRDWDTEGQRDSGSGASTSRTVCEASGSAVTFRSVGVHLESIVPFAQGRKNGLKATYSGPCEGRRRTAEVRLLCDGGHSIFDFLWENMGVLGRFPFYQREPLVGVFAEGGRPNETRSCEDIAIEWTHSGLCPLCQPSFYSAVKLDCKHNTYASVPVKRIPCHGGASAPPELWKKCPTDGINFQYIVIGAVASAMMWCLGCYVLLLRRRYAKYMVLEEEQVVATKAGGGETPAPQHIGAPSVHIQPHCP